MKCIVEVLGQPQDRLLNGGIYTHNFFKKEDERLNELTWRLMVVTCEIFEGFVFNTFM